MYVTCRAPTGPLMMMINKCFEAHPDTRVPLEKRHGKWLSSLVTISQGMNVNHTLSLLIAATRISSSKLCRPSSAVVIPVTPLVDSTVWQRNRRPRSLELTAAHSLILKCSILKIIVYIYGGHQHQHQLETCCPSSNALLVACSRNYSEKSPVSTRSSKRRA